MRDKGWSLLGVAAAAGCLAFHWAQASLSLLDDVMAFPFAPIGAGLRALSLSGSAGNAIAIALYLTLSLLPLLGLLRRPLHWEDALLGLMAPVLLLVWFCAVNPGLLFPLDAAMESALLGGAFWMLLVCYGLLRLLRACFAQGAARTIGWCLGLLYPLFTCAIFGSCLGDYLAAREAFLTRNTGGHQLTEAFLLLQLAVSALPYALDLWILPAARRLLDAARADRYSAQTVDAAGALANRCRIALSASLLAHAGFNLLQVLCLHWLRSTNVQLIFPVTSVLFVLLVLLLARQYAEGKTLKDDNDAFI